MSNANENQPAPIALFRFHVGLHSPDGPNTPADTAKRRAVAVRTLASSWEALTVQDVSGYWNGTPEPSIVAEVYAPDSAYNRARARDVAVTLGRLLSQECVGLGIVSAAFLLI
jgi:hypothetical protein